MTDDSRTPSEPCEILPHCPICPSGQMEASMHLRDVYVCVCLSCGTSLSVPREAMNAMRQRSQRGE